MPKCAYDATRDRTRLRRDDSSFHLQPASVRDLACSSTSESITEGFFFSNSETSRSCLYLVDTTHTNITSVVAFSSSLFDRTSLCLIPKTRHIVRCQTKTLRGISSSYDSSPAYSHYKRIVLWYHQGHRPKPPRVRHNRPRTSTHRTFPWSSPRRRR